MNLNTNAKTTLGWRQTDLYATAAIIGGTTYIVLQAGGVERMTASLVGMATVAGLRLAAIWWRLRLPVFDLPNERNAG